MKIGIFGASGFAREVGDICLDIGYEKVVYIDHKENEEKSYFGFPLVNEDHLADLIDEGYTFTLGIGDNKVRKKVYEKFNRLQYVNIIHPSATVGHKMLEEMNKKIGLIITSGVRFTNNIKFGNFGVYNLNCTVGHDCIIEDFVTIAPGANISGNVKVAEGAYIGTNATIIQGKSIENKLVIGKYSTVGAGSVVTKNVPEHTVVKGVPAK